MAQVMGSTAPRQRNLSNESADYVAKRDKLRMAEIYGFHQWRIARAERFTAR